MIRGTSGRDIIHGLGGNDRLFGLAGGDIICGGPGRDRIVGGKGADVIDGGLDGDRLIGSTGSDQIFGGRGNDLLIGGTGDDVLDGGRGRRDRLLDANGAECADPQGLDRTVTTSASCVSWTDHRADQVGLWYVSGPFCDSLDETFDPPLLDCSFTVLNGYDQPVNIELFYACVNANGDLITQASQWNGPALDVAPGKSALLAYYCPTEAAAIEFVSDVSTFTE